MQLSTGWALVSQAVDKWRLGGGIRVSFGFFSTLPLASYLLLWMLEAAHHLLLVQVFPELQICVAVKPDHVGVICGTLGLPGTK